MSGLVFVATDASAKVPASQRGLIRSHCMRSRNKLPQSRRSQREARKLMAAFGGDEDASSQKSTPSVSDEDLDFIDARFLAGAYTQRPLPTPSDWALIKFPVEMDRTSQMHFHRYFACNPVRDPVFPFKLFGIKVDVHTDELWLSSPLIHDELFCRTMDLMVSSSNDLVYGLGLSNRTRRKLVELLPLLNSQLAQPDAHEGIALYVVGILASVAVLFGDYTSASVHSKGISQILSLRAGSPPRPDNVMLGLALDRLSFASSLLTNNWTPIHAALVQDSPAFPEEVLLLYSARDMVSSHFVPDRRLALVFYTLQCTTLLLDTHDFGASSVNGSRMQEAMGFVQSQLLDLRGQLTDAVSRIVHLSLMAFIATTFRVPGQYEHPCCARLAEPLLAACISNYEAIKNLPDAIRAWLLVIGVITASAVGDKRVRLAWRFLLPAQRTSWKAVSSQARRVVWIDAIHNALGRRAFKALCPA